MGNGVSGDHSMANEM